MMIIMSIKSKRAINYDHHCVKYCEDKLFAMGSFSQTPTKTIPVLCADQIDDTMSVSQQNISKLK